MSVSSGTRRLLAEVASFAVAVAILAVAVINSDRIRSTVGEIVAGAPLPQSATITSRVSTANGTARVAPLMLERVTIGDITVRNVRGFVSERGAMRTTLLGMTFLGRLSKVEMRPGKLVLHE
jgi:aspartyl protease family protein